MRISDGMGQVEIPQGFPPVVLPATAAPEVQLPDRVRSVREVALPSALPLPNFNAIASMPNGTYVVRADLASTELGIVFGTVMRPRPGRFAAVPSVIISYIFGPRDRKTEIAPAAGFIKEGWKRVQVTEQAEMERRGFYRANFFSPVSIQDVDSTFTRLERRVEDIRRQIDAGNFPAADGVLKVAQEDIESIAFETASLRALDKISPETSKTFFDLLRPMSTELVNLSTEIGARSTIAGDALISFRRIVSDFALAAGVSLFSDMAKSLEAVKVSIKRNAIIRKIIIQAEKTGLSRNEKFIPYLKQIRSDFNISVSWLNFLNDTAKKKGLTLDSVMKAVSEATGEGGLGIPPPAVLVAAEGAAAAASVWVVLITIARLIGPMIPHFLLVWWAFVLKPAQAEERQMELQLELTQRSENFQAETQKRSEDFQVAFAAAQEARFIAREEGREPTEKDLVEQLRFMEAKDAEDDRVLNIAKELMPSIKERTDEIIKTKPKAIKDPSLEEDGTDTLVAAGALALPIALLAIFG
jgi:hypothetical protein